MCVLFLGGGGEGGLLQYSSGLCEHLQEVSVKMHVM